MTTLKTRLARIEYGKGYDAGAAEEHAAIAAHRRPERYARATLSKLRHPASLALRDDYGWGYRDGRAVTLTTYLYLTDGKATP